MCERTPHSSQDYPAYQLCGLRAGLPPLALLATLLPMPGCVLPRDDNTNSSHWGRAAWQRNCISLRLNFLICKMETIIGLFTGQMEE